MANQAEHRETRGGKGDARRPLGVSKKQFNDNWDRIFNKEKKDGKKTSRG
jgi:hypothetical protein